SGSAAPPRSTAAPGCAASSSRSTACPCGCSATFATRCSANAAPHVPSDRRKARARTTSRSSNGGSPTTTRSPPTRPSPAPALAPDGPVAGAGGGGGLGAAFASLGAELVPGSELVLDRIGFDQRAREADLVVTGEGTVDEGTLEGKAPGAVSRRCVGLGVRCELFGGVVRRPGPPR